MSDEYLWNKEGRDREVETLEDLLAPLSHEGRGPAPAPQPKPSRWRPILAVLAAAAGIAIAIRAGGNWGPTPHPTVETAAAPREIDLHRYGTVSVQPGAVVEVVRQTDEDIRLRLSRGTIEARISLAARPRVFQVETPATTCVDLGCHYTLTVEPDGSTFVHVELGQVAFVEQGRETWIPEDASCRAWPSRGSGTPRWDDARPELCQAIDNLDRTAGAGRAAGMQKVAELSTEPRDALSLWHLAHEPDVDVSGCAWDALVRLTGVPQGVDDSRAPESAEAWKVHLESIWEAAGGGR